MRGTKQEIAGRQAKLLAKINEHVEKHRCPPTRAWLAIELDVSIGTVRSDLMTLWREEKIYYKPRRGRALGVRSVIRGNKP